MYAVASTVASKMASNMASLYAKFISVVPPAGHGISIKWLQRCLPKWLQMWLPYILLILLHDNLTTAFLGKTSKFPHTNHKRSSVRSHTLAPTSICDLSHSLCWSPLTDLGHISLVTFVCHPLWFVCGHRKGIFPY